MSPRSKWQELARATALIATTLAKFDPKGDKARWNLKKT
jgi:hypothetical protein